MSKPVHSASFFLLDEGPIPSRESMVQLLKDRLPEYAADAEIIVSKVYESGYSFAFYQFLVAPYTRKPPLVSNKIVQVFPGYGISFDGQVARDAINKFLKMHNFTKHPTLYAEFLHQASILIQIPKHELCGHISRYLAKQVQRYRCLEGSFSFDKSHVRVICHNWAHAESPDDFSSDILLGVHLKGLCAYEISGCSAEEAAELKKEVKEKGRKLFDKVNRHCVVCQKQNSLCDKTQALKACSRCKSVYYCNAECQKQHWPTHKAACKKKAKDTLRTVADATVVPTSAETVQRNLDPQHQEETKIPPSTKVSTSKYNLPSPELLKKLKSQMRQECSSRPNPEPLGFPIELACNPATIHFCKVDRSVDSL